MITSRKCRKTRNKVLMCNFHPDFTVFRARVAYRTNNQKEFTIIPFRCTGYDGQHFVKDIEIEDKTATSVDVAYILTVSLSGENKLFKDTSNLEVLKESEEYITVSLDKKRCSKTDVKPKRRKRLSPEEEEAQVREVERILRSDPEVYNQFASSSVIKSENKHCENEAKNKALAITSAIKQICFDYMCEAQSTSKKQNLANALTCYTKIKQLIKRNSSAISESGEISKIKNLIQNMQSICMKLASEIHDERSKTLHESNESNDKKTSQNVETSQNESNESNDKKNLNESNDKKTSQNVETSQNESNDKKNLNESIESIESEDFALFRQNYTAFGFP